VSFSPSTNAIASLMLSLVKSAMFSMRAVGCGRARPMTSIAEGPVGLALWRDSTETRAATTIRSRSPWHVGADALGLELVQMVLGPCRLGLLPPALQHGEHALPRAPCLGLRLVGAVHAGWRRRVLVELADGRRTIDARRPGRSRRSNRGKTMPPGPFFFHGAMPPLSSGRPSGTTRSSSNSRMAPSPWQVGQAPKGVEGEQAGLELFERDSGWSGSGITSR
jgi:hypothetical protein